MSHIVPFSRKSPALPPTFVETERSPSILVLYVRRTSASDLACCLMELSSTSNDPSERASGGIWSITVHSDCKTSGSTRKALSSVLGLLYCSTETFLVVCIGQASSASREHDYLSEQAVSVFQGEIRCGLPRLSGVTGQTSERQCIIVALRLSATALEASFDVTPVPTRRYKEVSSIAGICSPDGSYLGMPLLSLRT